MILEWRERQISLDKSKVLNVERHIQCLHQFFFIHQQVTLHITIKVKFLVYLLYCLHYYTIEYLITIAQNLKIYKLNGIKTI